MKVTNDIFEERPDTPPPIVYSTDEPLGLPLIDRGKLVKEEDVEKLAYDYYWNKSKKVFSENSRPDLVIGFVDGYKANTKVFTMDDMVRLVEQLKDYTHEGGVILGYDEREPEEFVNIFIQSLTPQPVGIEEIELKPVMEGKYSECKPIWG